MRDYLFNGEEQGVVQDILAVLKPMNRATIFVSSEKQPTASRKLPTLAKLRMEMTISETDSALAKEMKQKILDNLNKRYSDQSISSFLLKQVTWIQDISINNLAKEGAVLFTKQAIRDMCIKVAEHQATSKEEVAPFPSLPAAAAGSSAVVVKQESSTESYEPPLKKHKVEFGDYDDWLNDVIYLGTEQQKCEKSKTELINKELDSHDTEAQIKGDPLEWWKSREASMPILAEVARAVLHVPGSSVPSERVFSKSGQLLNKRRASLSKNVDMLIFLNKNYSFKHLSK